MHVVNHAMPCHAVPCCSVLQFGVIFFYAILCHFISCHAVMLCIALLCYAMLCYAMLCYAYPSERKRQKFFLQVLKPPKTEPMPSSSAWYVLTLMIMFSRNLIECGLHVFVKKETPGVLQWLIIL